MFDEGYIKFSITQIDGDLPDNSNLEQLNLTRTVIHKMGLLGVYPNGIGFGNVSVRDKGDSFIISGSATGSDEVLSLDKYAFVKEFNLKKNSVISVGKTKASSESMSHGAVYRANKNINSVIHIHSKKMFDCMLKNGYVATPSSAQFGTPQLAIEIFNMVKDGKRENGIIVMAGHNEGIIFYGNNIKTVEQNILSEFGKF